MADTSTPVVGALALHKSNQLDARPVAAVSKDGHKVQLQIGTVTTPWIPAENYTYTTQKD